MNTRGDINMDRNVLELENVKKIYETGDIQTPALRGVNLKIKQNEIIAIMGPSGSGKSTLLHMIGALDKPTSGKIRIGGMDISKFSEPQLAELRCEKIGFVFQFYNLHPTLTALENVELPLIISEKSKKARRKKALKLLDAVKLKQRVYHLPSQLSGGEHQRVAIARALANDPQIILADEPTGNLDTKTEAQVMDFLLKIQRKRRMTLVIATHEKEIAKHAQEIVYLIDGKIKGGS